MPDDTEVAPVGVPRPRRTLPPEALDDLREAFAGEVAARLPRLLTLLHEAPAADALRDAHALGSSAVVVGEADASRSARALEAELSADAPDAARVHDLVRELAARLESWVGSTGRTT